MNLGEANTLYIYDNKELIENLDVLTRKNGNILITKNRIGKKFKLKILNQEKEKARIEYKGKDYTIQTYMEKLDDI